MNAEERFVRAATRGLARRARLDAQAELRSHLHERVQQLRLEGVPGAQASAQAMQELGHSATIRRSLWGAHPPLHLLWWTGLVILTLWTGWNLRDVQTGRSYYGGPQRERYGSVGFVGRFGDGVRLEDWAKDLPDGLTVSTSGAQPVLTSVGWPPVPLTGGPRSDRPLILFTQELMPYQDRFSGSPGGPMRPTIPAFMTGFVRVRGPFLNTSNLAMRAFRLGWPVQVDTGRVSLAGQALPPTAPGDIRSLPTVAADLTVTAAWLHLGSATREKVGMPWEKGTNSSKFPMFEPLEGPWAPVTRRLSLKGARPGARYVLVTRLPTRDPDRAANGSSDLLTSTPHGADADGEVTFPLSHTLAGRGTQYRGAHLLLMGDLGAWGRQAVSDDEFPTLVLQVPETVQRQQPPPVFAPPYAVGQRVPLED
ncbi:permease prefix domain 1-containing protein [Deinococcus koreensis]|uniref:Uncharacterized protein n=1 Tax=Deinococcus koreensis TaxID=2054903 RepID=A0A2K3UZ74_9DEIO|nr:permease prefix domain 1-containing protein [Deinococcus koreensis]PNY81846.1 hypothetical protein CVO96_11085 [Deinococcus koreensis]